MPNIVPATNVSIAAIAGLISAVVEHVCEANGVAIPPDIASALPAAIAVIVAHLWDVCTGGNVKPPADQSDKK